MVKSFGTLPNGAEASVYTISSGALEARITDFGATLVSLMVPDRDGNLADVVLGFDQAADYAASDAYFGATVGRGANRIRGGRFPLNGREIRLAQNDGENNLHSGPDGFHLRLWKLLRIDESSVTFRLDSPNADQGYPGNVKLEVSYRLEKGNQLVIAYRGVSDQDTVLNLTNHSYFNLAGHEKPERAMEQTLMLPARCFTVADSASIPTGEMRCVAGTPMDFRQATALGARIGEDYECLKLQKGYDHNYEVFCAPCAVLTDPESGRTMSVFTDCPGIQVYTANYTDTVGKNGAKYPPRCGVALETQFYPDSVNHPEWAQPFVKAGQVYHSVTRYCFK